MINVGTEDADLLVDQAVRTANAYAVGALEILSCDDRLQGWSQEAKATFIAGYMRAAAMDFQSAAIVSAGQHIAKAITSLKDEL